jgi:hypothetical protein
MYLDGERCLRGDDDVISYAAMISSDKLYRYRLDRIWDEHAPLLGWCMLNPSTADANIDDPTIRRCIGFAKRERFGGIIVVNLMAFRATSPKDLIGLLDPYGPLNDEALRDVAQNLKHGTIICAWGSKAPKKAVERALSRIECVTLKCLGLTCEGHPKHPLYIRSDQPFLSYGAPS